MICLKPYDQKVALLVLKPRSTATTGQRNTGFLLRTPSNPVLVICCVSSSSWRSALPVFYLSLDSDSPLSEWFAPPSSQLGPWKMVLINLDGFYQVSFLETLNSNKVFGVEDDTAKKAFLVSLTKTVEELFGGRMGLTENLSTQQIYLFFTHCFFFQ